RADRELPMPLRVVPQHVRDPDEPRRTALLVDREVERVVAHLELLAVALLGSLDELLAGSAQPREHVGRQRLDAAPGDLGIDERPHGMEIPEVLEGHRPHAKATLGREVDEALRYERLERLSDRNGTHAQVVRGIDEVNALVRPEAPSEDVLTQLVGRTLDER